MSKCYILQLIAIIMLLQAMQGLTRPFNSCPDIVINSIQITNLPSSDFSSSYTTTAPFAVAQPDSSYQALASFQHFVLSQAEYKIVINMQISSKATSSLSISFTGPDSGGFITTMKVKYIVIPSVYSSAIQAFDVDCCFSFMCLFIRGQSVGNIASTTKTFPSILNSGTNLAMVFFNSVFLQTTNYPTNNFGQSVDINIINSTHYSLDFKNVATVSMIIGKYIVSVIVYHVPSPSLGISIVATAMDKNNPSASVSDVSNTFFGFNQFSLVNGKMDFAIGSTSSTMTLTLGPQMLGLKVDLLTFTLGQCCINTPYIDTVQSVCVDLCPERYYLQTGTVNCLPCLYDCYTCTNSLTCSTCSNSIDKRQLNSSNRCQPITNYYESGVTLAAACSYPNCCGDAPIKNLAQSACVSSCPTRTYLVNNTVGCLTCAYDCYTCDNNATCLTCNATTDYRQFNSTTGRCDPLTDNYETGTTVAANCSYPNCCGSNPYMDTNQSTCVASCPSRTYLQNNTINCVPCAYDCYTCNNNSTCLTCDNNTDKRQLNSTTNRCDPIHNYYESGVTVSIPCIYPNCCGDAPIIFTNQSACVASCPERRYLQNSIMNCLLCAFDCYNCTNNVTCTSCDNTTDHRQYNSTTNRCDPIYNYYESGVTIAALCTYPNCCGDVPIIFTAQSTCVASCPTRRYLQNNTMDCLPCAYDCYNCTNNATCTSCDNSTDHRQYNSTTNRCDPIHNYYDSGTTVAVLCSYPNCCGDDPIIFTAQSSCVSSCPSRRYLQNTTMDCLPCAYDCYNCTNNSTCIACDNSTDHRQFNSTTNRCDPIHNYYDSGATVAILCSYPNCCGDAPIIFRNQSVCASSCPVRTYLDNSTMDCLPCVYDCYNCTNHVNCTSCDNATDHRQFNPTTERCIPIYNYYDPGSTVALPCSYPNCCGDFPIVYTAQSICTDSCPVRTYLQPSIMDCFLCSFDCYTCIDSVNCLSCNNADNRQYNPTTYRCEPIINYYESGITTAARCLYPNCCGTKPINFYQNSTCLSSCPSNYTYVPATKTCSLCNPGYWPVSNICINILGCKGAKVVNFTTICLMCDSSAHYTLVNNTCVCSDGYLFSNDTQSCKEICGNGFHFDQKCDDGNLIDGDGCSSTCTVQTHFRCESDSSNQPSKCLFIGGKLKLLLNYVNKTEGKNQGIFSFKVSTLYIKLNLSKLFVSYNFTSNPNPTSLQATSTQDQILLYVDYDEDLQGNMAKLSLQLNQDYIENINQLSVPFSMSSVGSKLIVIKNYNTLATYNQATQMLSYVVLGVFMASSFAYKMIGVEILHSFLVIYLICIGSSYQTDSYIIFRSFKLINLNFIEKSINFYSTATASNYQIQSQLLSKQFLGVFLLLIICVFGILQMILYLKYSKQDDQQSYKKHRVEILIQTIQSKLYNIFIFPLTIGFLHFSLFPAFLANSSTDNKQQFNNNTYLILQLTLFITVLCSLVFFHEYRTYFTDNKEQTYRVIKDDKQYESVYLFFWLQVTLMLSVNCLYKFDWLQEYTLILYIRFCIFWFLPHRPYKRAIHNFGQFVNMIMVIIFVGWSVVRKYLLMFQEEDIEILLVFVIILLMSIALILTTIRIILQVKDNCTKTSKKKVKKSKRKGIKKQVEIDMDNVQFLLQQENRFRLEHMLINKRLMDINCLDTLKGNGLAKKEIMNQMKKKYLRIVNFEE